MIKEFIEKSWLVIVSALAFGLLISAIDGQLRPKIEQNAIDKRNNMLKVLYSDEYTFTEAGKFTTPDGEELTYFQASIGDKIDGFALIISGSGFADKIELLVGFNADLTKLKGIAVLKSQETPGFGNKINLNSKGNFISFKDSFKDKPLEKGKKLKLLMASENTRIDHTQDNQIVSISGSTITSKSVVKIVNKATKLLRKEINNK